MNKRSNPTQFDKFIDFLRALGNEKVEYILIGGVAVILYGMQRLTRDIDVFVKMESQNVERLKKALHSVFDDASIDEITFESLKEFPVIRYGSPDGLFIDIMSKLGEITTYETLEYDILDVDGVPVNIASPSSLFDLKKSTLRPEDKADAVFLKQLIDHKE